MLRSKVTEELASARYFELSVPEECPSGISTDSQTVTTSFSRYGRSHEIMHYYGNSCAPTILQTLEQRIDEVAGTTEWVACPPDGPCRER